MKRIILSIVFLIGLTGAMPAQAMDFYVFGVNLKWFKNTEPKDYGKMVLGGLACAVIHEGNHILYCKAKGMDYDFNLKMNRLDAEILTSGASRKELKQMAMAGYIGDSLAGLLLTSFNKTRNSYFTKGYTLTHSIGLATYNLRAEDISDFETIRENSGNEDTFFYGIAAISAHNLLRQEW